MNNELAWKYETNQTEEVLSERFQKFWQRMAPNGTSQENYWDIFTDQLQVKNKKPSLNYYDYILKSGFQPIYSITHRRPVGYEALIRPYKNLQASTPDKVFTNAEYAGVSGDLDIICHTLHAFNFKEITDNNSNSWLFLNIIPSSILHYSAGIMNFEEVLKRTGIKPHQIVIEILENDIVNDPRIDDAIDYFKAIGCKIAIDDFGAGHSNFERIWRLEPEMVKLDRSIITHLTYSKKMNFSLAKLVSLLHETGALVIAEGVETEEEALVALDADVDLIQGFYFAKPFLAENKSEFDIDKCEGLYDVFRKQIAEETDKSNRSLAPYVNYLDSFVAVLKSGVEIKNEITANNDVLISQGLRNLRRVYTIDENGYQISTNINISDSKEESNNNFSPLQNTSNSNWYYRSYFRNAIKTPNTIQCSGPYLSVIDAAMCITLSIAIEVNGKTVVVCCDIEQAKSNDSNTILNFPEKQLSA